MKLHYSQTVLTSSPSKSLVSVPYEITLLSNAYLPSVTAVIVSVPYEITLLSNGANLFTVKKFSFSTL